jgi:exopolysaccharide production protein ExoQ
MKARKASMTQTDTTEKNLLAPKIRQRKLYFSTNSDLMAFAFAFTFIIVCNFNPQLGALSAAAVFGLGFMSLALFPNMMWSNPMSKWALAIPMLSLLSALWSAHPSNTIYYSIQVILTVLVAIAMASFPNPRPIVKGLFWSTLLFAILSLIFGKYILWENEEYIFAGLTGSKNAYGAMNFYVALLGTYAFHYGLKSNRFIYCILGFVSVLVGFAGITLSRTSGALVTTIIGIALYFVFINLARFPKNVRVLFLVLGTAILFASSLLVSTVWDELYRGTLAYFGKDSGLTGRTLLWDIADTIIERHYWLGVGHFGFWVQNDPLPEAIWAEMGIIGRGGFNFHNTLRELMVHFGILGTVLYLGIVIVLFVRLLRTVIFENSMENSIFAVIVLSIFTKFSFEAVLPLGPVSPDAVFIVTALALRPRISSQFVESVASVRRDKALPK